MNASQVADTCKNSKKTIANNMVTEPEYAYAYAGAMA
jgi:hypothetical protein